MRKQLDPDTESELFALIKTFQTHHHSKKCRKYRNKKCRFRLRNVFTRRQSITQPLSESLIIYVQKNKIEKKKFFLAKVKNYKFFLAKVKNYIDIELNPSKNYFYDN